MGMSWILWASHTARPYQYASIGALALVLVLAGWGVVARTFSRANRHALYTKIAQERRDQQLAAIDSFLSTHPLPNRPETCKRILAATVAEIVANVKGRVWRAEDVLIAYCHRAAAVHGELNCLTEVMFEAAVARARELDARTEKNGVLFGVPISLKDSVGVAGVPSSVGLIRWRNECVQENSRIVECLLEAGAVPFCKTNVPQTMMSFECRNPLWGTTENPFKKGLSPGGSSGGEAALISAGGSVLGLGSDIGGSLRIPAHFCGICALKPSEHRLSSSGCRAFSPSTLLVNPVHGPMARTVGDLIPLVQACLGKPDVDVAPTPELVPLPLAAKLTFGVSRSTDFLQAMPACIRAVDVAIDAVRTAGHRIVEFDFPFPILDLTSLMYEIISADSGYFYLKELGDEPVDRVLTPFTFLMQNPKWVLWLLSLISKLQSDPRPRQFFRSLGKKDCIQLKELLGRRKKFISSMNAAWSQAGIDALIMPAFATPALPHGSFARVSFAASYTFIWNILDYVAGTLPVTKVDPHLDSIRKEHHVPAKAPRPPRLFETELERLYRPEEIAGLPLGVQVVTPQYCEAQALQAMQIVSDAVLAQSQAPSET